MKYFILITVLLFSATAWASEVDGNSFFCANGVSQFVLTFKNGRAIRLQMSGGESSTEYTVVDDTVFFPQFDGGERHFRMSRKTLGLYFHVNHEPGSLWYNWACQKSTLEIAVIKLNRAREAPNRGNQF